MRKTAWTAALLIAMAAPTAAQQNQNDVQLLGSFHGAGGRVLAVATMRIKADASKAAGIDLMYPHLDDHYKPDGKTDDLSIMFLSSGDWQAFAVLWHKARTHPSGVDFGHVFDGDTMLSLSTDRDGDITFTLAGDPNAANLPQKIETFALAPKDFPAFDQATDQVTAYFRQ